MTQQVVVIDDERAVLRVIERFLTQEGFKVHTASDASGAESLFEQVAADLVILDVMLPDGSGLELTRDLRARSDVPIIIVSARCEEVDRVLGLEFGADDYVTKPFSPRELVGRVKAVLKRARAGSTDSEVIAVDDLRIDTRAREVRLSGASVPLTSSEYELLAYLGAHHGCAGSRHVMLAALHDEAPGVDERVIDAHVHRIRDKIEPDPKEPTHLVTVRGFGYRLGDG